MPKQAAAKKPSLAPKFSKAAATKTNRVHVVPADGGWSVKKEGAKRSSAVRSTKDGAVKAARSIKSADRIIVHKKDGTIQRNTKAG